MVSLHESAPVLVMLGFGFLAALPLIGSAIGNIFGGASKGSQQTDVNRQNATQNRDQLLAQLYQAQQQAQNQAGQLDLQRKQFESGEEGTNFKRALIGQLLQNAQPLSIEHPGMPKSTGGLSVASLGQGGRDTGSTMALRALQRLSQKPSYTGGEILDAPSVSPVGRMGGNGFLNALGLIGSAVGGIGTAAQNAQQPFTLPGPVIRNLSGPQ